MHMSLAAPVLALALIICIMTPKSTCEVVSRCIWQNTTYVLHNDPAGDACESGFNPLKLDSIMEASVMTLFPWLRLAIRKNVDDYVWYDNSIVNPIALHTEYRGSIIDDMNCPTLIRGVIQNSSCTEEHFVCEAPSNTVPSVSTPCVQIQQLEPCSQVSSFSGSYYIVCGSRTTWPRAQGYCMQQGGHLATITSREEHDFVESILPTNGIWWIGLTSGYKSDHFDFSWAVTNEPFQFGNEFGYPWHGSEPENRDINGVKENCIFTRSGWGDVYCEVLLNFVCEIDSGNFIPPNVPVVLYSDLSVDGVVTFDNTILKLVKPNTTLNVTDCINGAFSIDATSIRESVVLILHRIDCKEVTPKILVNANQCVEQSRSSSSFASIFQLKTVTCNSSRSNVASVIWNVVLLIVIMVAV